MKIGTRISLTFKNDKLYQARLSAGHTFNSLSKETGLCINHLIAIENLRTNPSPKTMWIIGKALMQRVEDIFPERLLEVVKWNLKTEKQKYFITEASQIAGGTKPLLTYDVSEIADDNIKKEEILKIVDSLDARRSFVLKESFGLEDGVPKSDAKIASLYNKKFGYKVCRGRISQIRQSALIRIKRPIEKNVLEDDYRNEEIL